MGDYVRVFETANEEDVNEYINKGWDLIGTSKITQHDGDASYIKFTLGLSTKEYANRLLAIVKTYEKHGLKDTMFEKVASEIGSSVNWYNLKAKKSLSWYELSELAPSKAPLAKFMTDYEHIVNNADVICLEKDPFDDKTQTIENDDDEDMPF